MSEKAQDGWTMCTCQGRGMHAPRADCVSEELDTCTVRRRPLWPGQKPARCDKPAGHWPGSDHHWIEVDPR